MRCVLIPAFRHHFKPCPSEAPRNSYGADSKTAALVDEYLLDLSATQSAIRAGYSTKKARQKAYRLELVKTWHQGSARKTYAVKVGAHRDQSKIWCFTNWRR
ncbi:terminase small subunit [Pseudomonas palleroniana]|uniref:terminase small subunit n=1 Tax=Pseudomonas palleroniana TaxID=191390 RepID=UPI00398F4E32